jgi:hypothetical protein
MQRNLDDEKKFDLPQAGGPLKPGFGLSGAVLPLDNVFPQGAGLEGNVRRAIDIHEDDKVDEAALKDLIRAAVALNLKGKSEPKPKRKSPL